MSENKSYYVVSYGFRDCEPIGTIIASHKSLLWDTLDSALREEAEFYADSSEDESVDEILDSMAVYGPVVETEESVRQILNSAFGRSDAIAEFEENLVRGKPFAMVI